MPNRKPYTLDRVVRLVITVALIAGGIWLIKILKDVLLPFGVACLIAYIFEPFVQYNRRLLHLKGRVIAVFVTLFEITFFFSALCYFLVPSIIDQAHKMADMFKVYAETKASIPFLPDSLHDFLRQHVDFHELSSMLTQQEWSQVIEDALSATWSFITGSITVLVAIFSWIIVLIYVIFIMIDYEKLGKGFRSMVPPKFRPVCFKIGDDIKRSMNHYFRGQALVSFITGIMYCIGFSIVGLPMGIAMGLLIGVLNMVPYLQLTSIPLTALLCLVCSVSTGVNFWTIFGECILIYCFNQSFNDLFMTPKIMGKAMGLNPVIILLSLSVWGTLLGFLGMIIALPLTTLLLAYYDEYIIMRHNDDSPPGEGNADDLQAINDMFEYPLDGNPSNTND